MLRDSLSRSTSISPMASDARRQAAATVNTALTLLYWRVGDRIRRDVLGGERARYGQQILATVSQDLVREFGRGFEVTNLTRMMKFAEAFPEEEIVATLSQQLSWSHFRELLPLDQSLSFPLAVMRRTTHPEHVWSAAWFTSQKFENGSSGLRQCIQF